MIITPINERGELVEVQDFMKITDRFGGIYGIYYNVVKKKAEEVNMVTGWTWKH